jgi:hypothetical protein
MSTGCPFTVIRDACPHVTIGRNANAAPAAANRFSASRLEAVMRASYIG